MTRYIIRSLKYIVQLIFLFAIMFGVMEFMGTSSLQTLSEVFLTNKGLLLIAFVLFIAAVYPKFGFVKRTMHLDLDADREKIMTVMDLGDYELVSEDKDVLTFRAKTFLKKLSHLWEDEIIITRDDNYISIEGVRKEVVKAQYRLKSML